MKTKLENIAGVLFVLFVLGLFFWAGYSDYQTDLALAEEEAAEAENPSPPDAETLAYREQLRQEDEQREWYENDHFIPTLRDKVTSPDGKWICWVDNITPYVKGYEQATYDEIRLESSDGTEHQLDGAEYGYDNRKRWLSKPVFGANSQRVAVFERDELGTGRILIWTLSTGARKVVSPSRGDLEKIYSDKKGVFHIGPERADYSYD